MEKYSRGTHDTHVLHTYTRKKGKSSVHVVNPSKRSIENIVRHSEVSEKVIEDYLVEKAKGKKLPCLKYSNPNMVGYPDRLLVLPNAKVIWVELKSKGRKPSKIQEARITKLISMGHVVKVIDNKADIDKLINEIEK